MKRTPSFSVSSTKGIFKCFGCGRVEMRLIFIMEQEHLTYVESLRYLARKYHIEIEERELTLKKSNSRTTGNH